MRREAQNFVIETAYARFSFHAFKVDRETLSWSRELRDGPDHVRDVIRALCLSDTLHAAVFTPQQATYRVAPTWLRSCWAQVYGKSRGDRLVRLS